MRITESQLGYAEIIAKTIREPFIILDKNHRVLEANRSFYQHFQLSREETENRLIYELDKGHWNIPGLRRLLETITYDQESIEDYEIRLPFESIGDKILVINARCIVSEIADHNLILLAIEDATERKHAEELLQIERGRLLATLKSIPDEMWITDAHGIIIERNASQIQNSLGKSNWNNVDSALKDLELLNPDGTRRAPEDAALPRALRGEITQNVLEMIRNLKTGELRWREVSSSPIRDEMGNIIGAVAIARDITERKRIEEELSKSEQRFRALATTGFSVLYQMNPDWSEMWQLSGSDFLADTNESNRNWLKEYIPIQEHSRVLLAIDEAIRNKSIFELEHRAFQADGSIGWTHSRAVPLVDSKGEIIEWFGAARDITENKKDERALQIANKKFLGLFNNKIVGLAYCQTVFDSQNQAEDYIILDINPTYEHLTGIKKEQIVGKKITEAAPGVSQDLINRHNQVALTGEEDRFEIYEPVTHRWYEVNVFSPDKGYFIALFSNITERKLAEEELHKSEQRFRALATAGFSVVYRMNPDWSEMWQLSGSDFLTDTNANRNWIKEYIPGQDHSLVISAIDEAIRNKSIFELEHRVIQADGSIAWTHSRAVPLINIVGEIIEWFGVARDITTRKQAEEDLNRRTEELVIANSDLEAFSYSVSHDLRTPLTAIMGLNYLFINEYGEKLDEHGKTILEHITASTEKMESIINDLLSLARFSRETMDCQKTDLKPFAKSVVEELRQSEPHRQVRIDIADSMPAIADTKLITIALTNLIGNAWKYTSKNPEALIGIGLTTIENEDVFFVRDNGVGFDMNFTEKIFQPFHRLHSEREFAGTGVGLAIVNRIIQRHGGKIWAESQINKGSTFYFTLKCQ